MSPVNHVLAHGVDDDGRLWFTVVRADGTVWRECPDLGVSERDVETETFLKEGK